MMYQGGLKIQIQLCCLKNKIERNFQESQIFCHVVFLRLWSTKSSFSFFSSGASAIQNPIVPDSSLINHQDFSFKAGIVVAWKADELQFHDQLTSHQHVNPSSQTEVSLHERNKCSRSEISTGFIQLYPTRKKKKKEKKYHMLLTVKINFIQPTSEIPLERTGHEKFSCKGKEMMSNPDQIF